MSRSNSPTNGKRSRFAQPNGVKPALNQQQALQQSKDNIVVAVRIRPLSQREQARGDFVVWGTDPDGSCVGTVSHGILQPRYQYDTVLAEHVGNIETFQKIGWPVIEAVANQGLNGTVFAYGVTSSGKTHTMMGNDREPGIIPQAILGLFSQMSRPGCQYAVKLSMLEIYNEVLTDLLDPQRTNLRIREDKLGGIYTEGALEAAITSAQEAIALIRAGETHRKISATTYNEDSSRSHTMCRLAVEAVHTADDSTVTRTLSELNLIDLAGSESARAEKTKDHRVEGGFINKSLLTLATVIGKLADGNAAHIPFRDSKLTRLLQRSLTGHGARIAIVCNITPASSQAEETHNTLKFAQRAKLIRITAVRNDIVDERSMIKRYQREIEQLKAQLADVKHEAHPIPDHVYAEVSSLKEQLQVGELVQHANWQEQRALKARIERLTRLILHQSDARLRGSRPPSVLRSRAVDDIIVTRAGEPLSGWAAHLWTGGSVGKATRKVVSVASTPPARPGSARQFSDGEQPGSDEAGGDAGEAWGPQLYQGGLGLFVARSISQQLMSSARSTSGELRASTPPFGGSSSQLHTSAWAAENEALKEQVNTLLQEMKERERELEASRQQMFARGDTSMNGSLERKLKMVEVDRSLLERQLSTAQQHVELLTQRLSTYESPEQIIALHGSQPSHSPPHAGGANGSSHKAASLNGDTCRDGVEELQQRVYLLEDEIAVKSEQMVKDRQCMRRLQDLMQTVTDEHQQTLADNRNIKAELRRVEMQNNRLLGYRLDDMTPQELQDLIGQLTQAVERVRISVQVRRLNNTSSMLASQSVSATMSNSPIHPSSHIPARPAVRTHLASGQERQGQQQQQQQQFLVQVSE